MTNPATKFTNRLAKEKSPYLLQHQNNPVDWYPWGPEAFKKAKEENKPIFLSVGYSTCHWCHVMAHECFENEEIAKLMNEHFINVKVDREERPDVDRVYMTFVQATTGSGGWPMSVWLTPDLKPFVGGTYFPPVDRGGRPGFPTVLRQIAEAWKNDREGITAHGTEVLQQLKEMAQRSEPSSAPAEAALQKGFDEFVVDFDDQLGGFGDAPKFPRPSTLNFVFRIFAREARKAGMPARAGLSKEAQGGAAAPSELSRDGRAALRVALFTLEKMADGGIHDHLGGGFHRYSVDKFWHVPHYEKMLYDQAQLAVSYLDAYQVTRDERWAKVARGICDYVLRDLTDKEGGFYSAEDADSLLEHGKPDHAEGAFYVWTKAEIDQLLGEAAAKIFNRFYGVEEDGNSPPGSDPHGELKGKNTLIQRLTVTQVSKLYNLSEEEVEKSLAASRAKLFEVRAKRPRPHLDDKIIAAWNGLMISAFARAAQVLDEPKYLAAAQRSAKFIREKMWKDGQLVRSYRHEPSTIAGFADDYASLIQGLLDLYETDFDVNWLVWAVQLQGKMDALFGDPTGGYFSTTGDDPTILLRMKEDGDHAEPAASSTAAMNLLRLAQFTGNEAHQKRALATLKSYAFHLERIPSALPQLMCALDASLAKPSQIVIAGKPADEGVAKMLKEVHARFIPNKVLLLADGGPGQKWLGTNLEFIRNVAPINGKATAYVCEDFVCQAPTNDPAKLAELLGK